MKGILHSVFNMVQMPGSAIAQAMAPDNYWSTMQEIKMMDIPFLSDWAADKLRERRLPSHELNGLALNALHTVANTTNLQEATAVKQDIIDSSSIDCTVEQLDQYLAENLDSLKDIDHLDYAEGLGNDDDYMRGLKDSYRRNFLGQNRKSYTLSPRL